MDPEANIREQRALLGDLRKAIGSCLPSHLGPPDIVEIEQDCARLCDLVEALDEWLSRGGFLPEAWRRTGAAPFGQSSETYQRRVDEALRAAIDTLEEVAVLTPTTDALQRANKAAINGRRALAADRTLDDTHEPDQQQPDDAADNCGLCGHQRRQHHDVGFCRVIIDRPGADATNLLSCICLTYKDPAK